MSPAGRRVLAWAIPVLFAAAIYLPAVGGARWVYDDWTMVAPPRDGPFAAWTTPVGYVWRPLAPTLQEGWMALFGRTPPAARGLNAGLHLLNVALVAVVGARRGASPEVAGAAALAWAVHPALPDAVGWSSDAGGVLSTTFLLLLFGSRPGATVAVDTLRTLLGIGAALLAKESAAAAVLLLAADRVVRDGARVALPTALAGAAAVGLWVGVHDAVSPDPATGVRLPLGALAAWLQMLPWLVGLPAQAGVAHLFDPTALAPALAGLAVLVAGTTLVAWTRSRPLRLAGLAWGLLLLPAAVGVPAVGFLPFRYTYGPSALAFALLGAVPAARPRWVGVLLLGWVALQLPQTLSRLSAWSSDAALWADERAREPEGPAVLWLGGLDRAREGTTRAVRRDGLRDMAAAISRAPAPFPGYDPEDAGYVLAQTAFLAGEPAFALDRVQAWIQARTATGAPVPANAWCLVADAQDQLGRVVDPEAERRCAGG